MDGHGAVEQPRPGMRLVPARESIIGEPDAVMLTFAQEMEESLLDASQWAKEKQRLQKQLPVRPSTAVGRAH